MIPGITNKGLARVDIELLFVYAFYLQRAADIQSLCNHLRTEVPAQTHVIRLALGRELLVGV